jgi:hypothetical protein
MLFANASAEQFGDRRSVGERRRLVESIFTDFRKTFPGVEYEHDEKSGTVNAQAIARDSARLVRMYGGLGFHPSIGADGIVFTLLHETGHHLATGGRLAFRPDLGCECAADRWALTRGSAELRKRTKRTFDIGKAIADLDALSNGSLRRVPADSAPTEEGPPACWALDWQKRRLHLGGLTGMPVIRRCRLSDYYVSHS